MKNPTSAQLPQPSDDALKASQDLVALIKQTLLKTGGWVPFSRYFDMALYTPQLGYYSGGATKLGGAGDFTTAPEMHPLFGQCLAQQLAEWLPNTDGNILELGAGSGKLCVAVMKEFEALGCLPKQYLILDLSAELIERQKAYIAEHIPHLQNRIKWIDSLPEAFNGIILGNEVLDAMPFELISWQEDGIYQRGIACKDDVLVWEDKKLNPSVSLHKIAKGLSFHHDGVVPYLSEISEHQPAFVEALGACLEKGYVLFIDYGFAQQEYYHPQRSMGTAMGHYRHHSVQDLLFLPGLMDLTAHVDFTQFISNALKHQFSLLGYTFFGRFLLNCGITQRLSTLNPESKEYIQAMPSVQQWLSPAEMGELFKVVALGKNVQASTMPLGFADGDKSHSL